MKGKALLEKYGSYYAMLKELHPSTEWFGFKKARFPRHYWDNIENVKIFVQFLEKQFKIKTKEDWSRISIEQINQLGAGRLLRKYENLYSILKIVYPDISWNKQKFRSRNKRSAQRWLFLQLQQVYPSEELIEDYFHPLTRGSGQNIEFDVFLPSRNVGFEYQGEHHYIDLPSFAPLEMYEERDREKIKMAKENQIHLVQIPYTWDGSIPSLISIIPPDLLPSNSIPK